MRPARLRPLVQARLLPTTLADFALMAAWETSIQAAIPRMQPWIFILVASVIALAGCRSSGIAQRKAQSPESYQLLDQTTRGLVDKGKIQNGMDTNAVWLAWGRPTDAFSIDIPGGKRLIWNYEEKWVCETTRRVSRGTDGNGFPVYAIEHLRMPVTYVARSATFADGKVVQWKKYDPPVMDVPPEKLRPSPRLF